MWDASIEALERLAIVDLCLDPLDDKLHDLGVFNQGGKTGNQDAVVYLIKKGVNVRVNDPSVSLVVVLLDLADRLEIRASRTIGVAALLKLRLKERL